ncbi:hypothetical protein LINPERHAP2_LOCUS2659, partial [Linum perenne]
NWRPHFRPEDSSLSSLRVWVRLPGLPLEYFDAAIFTIVGNKIGRTVRIDHTTPKVQSGVDELQSTRISDNRFGALIDDAEMEIIDCEKSTNSAPTDKVPECSECGEEKENKDHGSAVANHKKDYSSKTAGSEARPHGVVPTPLGLGGSNKSISNGEPIPVKGGGPVSFPSQPHVSKTSLSKNVTANKSKERAGSGAGVPSASDQLRRKSIKGGVIVEPKIRNRQAAGVIRKMGLESSFRSDPIGFRGGIWLCWNASVVLVDILSFDTQFIRAKVSCTDGSTFLITAVYVIPNPASKVLLWDVLKNLSAGLSDPWVVIGDFNSTLAAEDRQGGPCLIVLEINPSLTQ